MTWNGVSQFEDAYDAAGIREDSIPPSTLMQSATDAALIVASDLPRAIASAARLAAGRPVEQSALLREIRLEPPRWVPFSLPIEAWDGFNHAQWTYRLFVGTRHEFVRRGMIAYGCNPDTGPVGISELRNRRTCRHHQGVVELENWIREIADFGSACVEGQK